MTDEARAKAVEAAALLAVGMSARSFARLCGIPDRTAQNYRTTTPVRPDLAEWLNRRVKDIKRDPPPTGKPPIPK